MGKKRFSLVALMTGALVVGAVAPAAAWNSQTAVPDEFKITGGKVAMWYSDFEGRNARSVQVDGPSSTFHLDGYYKHTEASSLRLTVKCDVYLPGDIVEHREYKYDQPLPADAGFKLSWYCDAISEVNVKSVPGDLNEEGGPNGVGKKQRDEDDLATALSNLANNAPPLRITIGGPDE